MFSKCWLMFSKGRSMFSKDWCSIFYSCVQCTRYSRYKLWCHHMELGELIEPTYSHLYVAVWSWESNNVNKVPGLWILQMWCQFYVSSRRVSGVSSKFCTVQVLLGQGDCFMDYEGFHISRVLIIHKSVNAFGTKLSVCNILDGRFSFHFI